MSLVQEKQIQMKSATETVTISFGHVELYQDQWEEL